MNTAQRFARMAEHQQRVERLRDERKPVQGSFTVPAAVVEETHRTQDSTPVTRMLDEFRAGLRSGPYDMTTLKDSITGDVVVRFRVRT